MQLIYTKDDSPEALARFHVDTLQGKATLISPKTVQVNQDIHVTAKEGIILCTGATPKRPSIPGLDTVSYLTYEEVWELDELPKRLTIIGGGPVKYSMDRVVLRPEPICGMYLSLTFNFSVLLFTSFS